MFFQLLIGGIMVGCIYALIGLGFSLIYSASGLMTFVQGEVFMLGAYISFTLVSCNLPFIIAILITLLIMFSFGMGLEKIMISPLLRHGSTSIHIMLATIGLSIFLQNLAMLIWGTEIKSFPAIFGETPIAIGLTIITPQQIAIVAISIICMFLVHLFMTKTKIGTSLRAAAQDPMAAGVVGINVSLSIGVTWGLSAVLAAIAGILLAPVYGVYAKMGAVLSTKGFAAAVVGGYGNMYGAMIGGLILGIIETFSAGFISSSYKDIISFAVLILVLFIKPSGIMKSKAN